MLFLCCRPAPKTYDRCSSCAVQLTCCFHLLRATRGARNPNLQVLVVQTLNSAIHCIKIYPVDRAIGFPNIYMYLLDSDSSSG